MTSRLFPVQTKTQLENRSIIYQYRGENRWLSNFWPCAVTLPAENDLPEMEFGNVETAYMAWKTLDPSAREKIQAMTPGQAKKFSYAEGFTYRQPYTDDLRLEIMENLVAQKFSPRNPVLLEQLIQTRNALLVEGNLHGDAFFGFDLNKGYGLNHLGRIQMGVRDKYAL